jgi:WD40 repeat protein
LCERNSEFLIVDDMIAEQRIEYYLAAFSNRTDRHLGTIILSWVSAETMAEIMAIEAPGEDAYLVKLHAENAWLIQPDPPLILDFDSYEYHVGIQTCSPKEEDTDSPDVTHFGDEYTIYDGSTSLFPDPRPLSSRLRGPVSPYELRRFTGYEDTVSAVAFSSSGDQLLGGSADNSLRLFDCGSGRQLREFVGHSGEVLVVGFLPNGREIFSTGQDNTFRTWDARSVAELHRVSGKPEEVSPMCTSPDGRYLLSAGDEEVLRVWESRTGADVWRLGGQATVGMEACFSRDGTWLAVGLIDGTVSLWSMVERKLMWSTKAHEEELGSLSISLDGRLILTSSRDGTTCLWDAASGMLRWRLPMRASRTWFSPDCRVILAELDAGRNFRLCLLDSADGMELREFKGHEAYIASACFSSDGRYVATGSHDTTMRLWCAAL